MNKINKLRNPQNILVLVAALGYFVDIYDLVLFSIVRVKSLTELGVPAAEIKRIGLMLLNFQMGGMLVGGIFWGILGDKKGRLSVLFGSIIMYSIANILNGFVQNVDQYLALRFIAGLGLAGELGAGITLVSESMSKEHRGYGTMVVATVGVFGAVVAGLVGDLIHWRNSYFVGGSMGLALLLLRIGVFESGMYKNIKESAVKKGDILTLIRSWKIFKKYICIILVAVPVWYVMGILITLSPEMGRAWGMTEVPSPARAIMFAYIGITLGDIASGWMSQVWKSRKRVLLLFLVMTVLSTVLYFLFSSRSLTTFYVIATIIGFATGYWAVFMTTASELFGTNLRSTVTTTSPNFVRGAVIPITALFQFLETPMGMVNSAIVVGIVVFSAGFWALHNLEETFGKDLNFVEE